MSLFEEAKQIDSTMFKIFFDRSPCALIVTDRDLLTICANPKASKLLNQSMLSDQPFLSFFDDTSKEKIKHYLSTSQFVESLSLDVALINADAECCWLELAANKHRSDSEVIIWSLSDITQRKAREKELEDLAYYDGLTGIYTRRYFFQLAETQMAQSNINDQSLSMLILDLDNFKHINDTYGHCTGDNVLQAFCTLISSKLRKSDIFGRIGGEEFSIVLPNTTQHEAVLTATRICNSVEEYFTEHRVTVSIGLVTLRNPNCTFKQGLKYADDALYQVKQNGKNGVSYAAIGYLNIK
ncbi:diguanylate cyclase [Vibrio sp. DNB22_17_1]